MDFYVKLRPKLPAAWPRLDFFFVAGAKVPVEGVALLEPADFFAEDMLPLTYIAPETGDAVFGHKGEPVSVP